MKELNWILGIGLVLVIIYSIFKDRFAATAQKGGSAEFNLANLPYKAKQSVMTKTELNFYHVLRTLFKDNVVICPQFPLGGLFYAKTGDRKQNMTYRNKIDRKTIDFLLCDANSMKPLAGIELDDRSHEREDRQKRDRLVNAIFEQTQTPLMRVKVQQAYSQAELRAALKEAIQKTRS